jgi:hypothetical protein
MSKLNGMIRHDDFKLARQLLGILTGLQQQGATNSTVTYTQMIDDGVGTG